MIVTLLAYGSFMLLLVVAAGDDLRELRIPNGIVAALAAVWIVWRIALAATHPEGALVPALSVADGLLGALVLGGGLLAVTLAFEALTGRRAMGGGDVKLMAAVGLFLGIEGGLVCLLTACLISLLLALLLPRLGWAPRPAPAAPAPAATPAATAPATVPTPAATAPTARASAPRPDSSFDGRETDVSRETYPHPVSDASRPADGAPSSERNALGAVPFGPGIAVGAGVALLSMVFL